MHLVPCRRIHYAWLGHNASVWTMEIEVCSVRILITMPARIATLLDGVREARKREGQWAAIGRQVENTDTEAEIQRAYDDLRHAHNMLAEATHSEMIDHAIHMICACECRLASLIKHEKESGVQGQIAEHRDICPDSAPCGLRI